MFDPITSTLGIVGLGYMFKRNRVMFIGALLLIVVVLANDIFTIELIPEFHYYGQSHPNTFHISGIIPIVYFLTAIPTELLYKYSQSKKDNLFLLVTVIVIPIIIMINLVHYFGQEQNSFIHVYNNVPKYSASQMINSKKPEVLYASTYFFNEKIFRYFLNDQITVKELNLSDNNKLPSLEKDQEIIIWPSDNVDLVKNIIRQPPIGVTVKPISNYQKLVDYILVE
jgi:hypothetical protein